MYNILDEVLELVGDQLDSLDPDYEYHCPCCGSGWEVCACKSEDLLVLNITNK